MDLIIIELSILSWLDAAVWILGQTLEYILEPLYQPIPVSEYVKFINERREAVPNSTRRRKFNNIV